MVLDRVPHETVLVLGAGKQLDGEDVGVAVDDPAGERRAQLAYAAGTLAQARHHEAEQRRVGQEPQRDRDGKTPIGGRHQDDGAAAVEDDVPDGVDADDDHFAQRRAGLQDPVGDAASEVVLEEGPGLADDVEVALPPDAVGEARVQRLVDQQEFEEQHAGADQHDEDGHAEELRPGVLEKGLARVAGHQPGDAADADRDGDVECGGAHAAEQKQQHDATRLADEVPEEGEQVGRRGRVPDGARGRYERLEAAENGGARHAALRCTWPG